MASYGVRITTPNPGSGTYQWDGTLDDLLDAIVDVLAQRVTPAGINVTSDVDVQGNHLIDVTALGFVPAAAPGLTNGNPNLYVDLNGELHFVDNSGNDVQVTLAGQIDVSLTGGVNGNRSAGATLNFSSSTNTWTMTDGLGNVSNLTIGGLTARGVHIVDSVGDAGFVALAVSSSIGSTQYGLTFPNSLNSGINRSLVTVDATGTLYYQGSALGGPSLVRMDVTGGVSFAQSASFTQYYDVSRAQQGAGGGSVSYGAGGYQLTTGGSSIDVGLDYVPGDQLVSVSYGMAGIGTTGSVWHRGDNASSAQIVRCAFNGGTQSLRTMQNGTATLTGTLPYTPPGTGSLYVNVAAGPAGSEVVPVVKAVWIRKLIS